MDSLTPLSTKRREAQGSFCIIVGHPSSRVTERAATRANLGKAQEGCEGTGGNSSRTLAAVWT